MNFLGYVFIAPVVTGGDSGQIVARLHVPAAAVWLAAALALALLSWLVGRAAPLFLGLLPVAAQAEPAARTAGLRALLLWPWLLGLVVLMRLSLPAPHPAVVANMFMSPMALRRAYANAQHLPTQPLGAGSLPQARWWLLAGLVGAAVGFRRLARGVAL